MDRLQTPRLVLRRWTPDDRAPFAALNADPVVMEHFPATLSRAESDALMDRLESGFAQHGFGMWAVEVPGLGCVGFTGLSAVTFDAPFAPCVEVGWRLARHAWGHGYAREAAREAVRFGFSRLGLPEIVSFTVPANTRSRRVMEALGMTRDAAGDFDHPKLPVGHALRRHVLYRIRPEALISDDTNKI